MPTKKNKNTVEKLSELFSDVSFNSSKGMNNFFDSVAKNIESLLGPTRQKNDKDQEGSK